MILLVPSGGANAHMTILSPHPRAIALALTKYFKLKHPRPLKPRLSRYKCLPISYGAKSQLTPEADASELLGEHRKCRIQEIQIMLPSFRWKSKSVFV